MENVDLLIKTASFCLFVTADPFSGSVLSDKLTIVFVYRQARSAYG